MLLVDFFWCWNTFWFFSILFLGLSFSIFLFRFTNNFSSYFYHLEALLQKKTEWPIILNSNAHILWPKGAQKCAHQNFSKKRTNAHMFWPKGAQKCAHQKFWLKVHNSISRNKNVFFKVHAIYQDILIANTWLKTYIFKFNKS